VKQASIFMGNMNYFGKTFKGTLWGNGDQKNDKNVNKNDDKNKNKTQTMRIPKTLA
jgi:hypothetical protein